MIGPEDNDDRGLVERANDADERRDAQLHIGIDKPNNRIVLTFDNPVSNLTLSRKAVTGLWKALKHAANQIL